MTKRKLIATRPDLVEECERLAVPLKRRHEPEAVTLAGRYRYDAATGDIYGPRGRLKPLENRGAYRVALWHEGKAVRVVTGRLAFALQHGRWPVGVRYLNGDTSDNRAENLSEGGSRRLQAAKQPDYGREPASGRVGSSWSLLDLRSRRGAWSGGRCLPDEIERIDRLLKAGDLGRRDRARLEHHRRRFMAVLEPCERAVSEAGEILKTGAESPRCSPLACKEAVKTERRKRQNRLPSGGRYRALKLMAWRMAKRSGGRR